MKQFLIAIDQLFNAVIGSGWADETLSAYYWRTNHWMRPVVDKLFFWQSDHCRSSYDSEIFRAQLPEEYRA